MARVDIDGHLEIWTHPMSIKNQRPLFISAAVILGLTIASLFGLNLFVDKISRLTPPSIAMAEPPRRVGVDDAIDKPKPPAFGMPPEGVARPEPDLRPKHKMPDMRDRQPDDAVRRVRNGKDAPDLRRTQPRPPNGKDDAAAPPSQKGPPTMPPNMNGGFYPPFEIPPGVKLDPKERERIEQELERRRQMYFNGPPPDYYPPPPYQQEDQQNGPGGYDNGYDYRNQDYYDEYEPDYGDLDSKLENPALKNEKTAAHLRDQNFESEPDEDNEADDYIFESPEE